MLNCKKTVMSKRGIKHLKMAQDMARSIPSKTGSKKRIIKGCLLQSSKSGRLLSASVLEMPPYIIGQHFSSSADPNTLDFNLKEYPFGVRDNIGIDIQEDSESLDPFGTAITVTEFVFGSDVPENNKIASEPDSQASDGHVCFSYFLVSNEAYQPDLPRWASVTVSSPEIANRVIRITYDAQTLEDKAPGYKLGGPSMAPEWVRHSITSCCDGESIYTAVSMYKRGNEVVTKDGLGNEIRNVSHYPTSVTTGIMLIKFSLEDESAVMYFFDSNSLPAKFHPSKNPILRDGSTGIVTGSTDLTPEDYDPDERYPFLEVPDRTGLPGSGYRGRTIRDPDCEFVARQIRPLENGGVMLAFGYTLEVQDSDREYEMEYSPTNPFYCAESLLTASMTATWVNNILTFNVEVMDIDTVHNRSYLVDLYNLDPDLLRIIGRSAIINGKCLTSVTTCRRRFKRLIPMKLDSSGREYAHVGNERRPPFSEFYINGAVAGTQDSAGAACEYLGITSSSYPQHSVLITPSRMSGTHFSRMAAMCFSAQVGENTLAIPAATPDKDLSNNEPSGYGILFTDGTRFHYEEVEGAGLLRYSVYGGFSIVRNASAGNPFGSAMPIAEQCEAFSYLFMSCPQQELRDKDGNIAMPSTVIVTAQSDGPPSRTRMFVREGAIWPEDVKVLGPAVWREVETIQAFTPPDIVYGARQYGTGGGSLSKCATAFFVGSKIEGMPHGHLIE